MDIVQACVRNPVKVAVGVLLVGLFGLISLDAMPMQLTPEVQRPTISVETSWPGGSPQEVEREIVQEQEEQLKSVEGLIKLSSECQDSRGTITLEFVTGTPMSEALLKVNSRLQQVREYPEEADEPVISTASSSDSPIAWFILAPTLPSDDELNAFADANPGTRDALQPVLRAGSHGLRLSRLRKAAAVDETLQPLLPRVGDVQKLQRMAENLIEARFERVPGVSNATVLGGREEELRVVVDPRRLAARGVTVADVRRALRARNRDTAGGDFSEGKRRYVVRTLGQFKSPEDVASVVLARRDGSAVYVRDVAEVELTHKKITTQVRNFGETALAINCRREMGANVIEVMDGLRVALAELNAGGLSERGLVLKQVYDETEYIDSAVGLVNQNIVVGGLLTILVLLLFLRSGRSTFVIALAIPTSIVGTFLVLNALGRSLNVISLAGLAFAVGMLVDNAVVVLENVFRHHQEGSPPFRAAVEGTKEVWGAVVASTLTTLAVFVPVVFVQEEAGQLFRDIALAISSAVALSLIVSVSLISTATARVLPSDEDGEAKKGLLARSSALQGLANAGTVFVDWIVGLNRWMQQSRVREFAVVTAFVAASVFGTWLLFPKVEYLPSGNRNLVIGILLPPPGYNLDQLADMGTRIEQGLQPYWDIAEGEAPPPDGPQIDDYFYVVFGRTVFIGVKAADPLRAAELVPLLRRAATGIPGTFALVNQTSLFERGIGAGRSVDVEITGPELKTLVGIAGPMFGMTLQALPNAQVFPKPSLDLANPEVHVRPRWERAAEMGITANDLGYTVNALVDGAYATDYYLEGERIDVSIVGEDRYASRTHDLAELPIATPSGDLVPLSSVADVTISSGPEQINRRERERTITIAVSPPPEMALEEAMDIIESQVIAPFRASGGLPPLYDVHLAGTADKLVATWEALRFNVILALIITYLLMAALFESWLYPLVILLSVPLGAVGGFAGLAALNVVVSQPLDVLTMLGFVILIGTVVNNPILIVHQTLNHMREDGSKPSDAILEAVRTRVRPIFMTTTTTVCGLLPLVVFPGAGSELYRGIGSVVLGGLIVSASFTLVLVPALFHLTMSARDRLFGAPAALGPPVTEAAAPSDPTD